MRSFLLTALIPLLFLFQSGPNTIKGKVINAGSQKPIANVLVYVIEGEEESLTNAKGEFTIKTRKAFPIRVTAQELSGKRSKVGVTTTAGNVTIQIP